MQLFACFETDFYTYVFLYIIYYSDNIFLETGSYKWNREGAERLSYFHDLYLVRHHIKVQKLYQSFSNKLLILSVFKQESIYGPLRHLVPFVQFKKREKHPWSVNFSLLHGCFSRFLNCTNGTKSRNAPHIVYSVIAASIFSDNCLWYVFQEFGNCSWVLQ